MAVGTSVRSTPRLPVLDSQRAMPLAAEEYARFGALLRALGPADWARRTDCPEWDVRAIAGHVLGMAQMTASLRASLTQNAAAARAGGGVDALTTLQVRRNAGLTPAEVVDRFAAVAPRAVRGRRRLGRVLRRLAVPEEQVVGGRPERWTFGFLLDVILTRDTWMHRIDISRAAGRELDLTPEHDGVLVADVVDEWASRHGRPYRLRLTGPAGGEWTCGEEPEEELELDAAEFCRVLSGREQGSGLLAQPVPF